MTAVAIIEDDRLAVPPLARALENAGYQVLTAFDGRSGLAMVQTQQPDLVILDILLPELDGWGVCKAIRQTSVVPILMLSALNEEVDRILGLELGADDYMTKPFSSRELLVRIKALLRRAEYGTPKPPRKNILTFESLVLDLDKRTVSKDGREISLRYKAFELLSLLACHPGEVLSRAEIFDQVWGTDWIGDTRTLEVHIRWLREKLEDDPSQPRLILTVRSVGYRFAPGR